MDEEVLRTLIGALSTIHDVSAPQQQRQLAQQYINNFKEGNPALFSSYGFFLARIDQPDPVRHFGLSLIETLIKQRWAQVSNPDKDQLKQALLELLAKGSKDMLLEKAFIKEKIVELVIEVAKREWPQRWKDMFDYFLQITQMGETQCELILMALRTLADDIKVYELGMTEQRRRDLQSGLNATLPTLFNFFYRLLETNFAQYSQKKNAGVDPQNDSAMQKNMRLLRADLSTLTSYCEWVPMNRIFEHNFTNVFGSLLIESSLRLEASECLLLIMSRKFKAEERAQLMSLFDLMDSFSAAMQHVKESDDEDYQFVKRLAQVLSLMGTHQLSFFTDKKQLPNNYEKFLIVLLAISNHPSLLMTSFAIPYWLLLFRDESLVKQSLFGPVVPEVLKICSAKLMKLGDMNPPPAALARYVSVDFDTRESFRQFFGLFKAKVMELTRIVSAVYPEIAFQFALALLQHTLQLKIQPHDIVTHGMCTTRSPIFVQLDAAVSFLECVMQGLPKIIFQVPPTAESDAKSAPFVSLAEMGLQLLFEYDIKDPTLITRQLAGIRAFVRVLQYRSQFLLPVVQKLLSMVTFGSEELKPGNVSPRTPDIIAARRKACTSLIHICHDMPKELLPHLPSLAQSIAQLSGSLNGSERNMLMEAMVAVSNSMKNYDQQVQFLTMLISASASEFSSAALSDAVKDVGAFIRFLGIVAQPTGALIFSEVDSRKKLFSLMQTFYVVSKRCAVPTDASELQAGGFGPVVLQGVPFPYRFPFSPFVKTILPNFLSCTKALHELWNPDVRKQIPEAWQEIYAIDPAVAANMMGNEKPGAQLEEFLPIPQSEVKNVRGWLESVRDFCYRTLMQMSINGDEFFLVPNLPQLLSGSVFTQLGHIENRHLRLFLHTFFTGYVRHCPTPLFPTHLAPFVSSLFLLLYHRFNTQWTAHMQRVSGAQPTPLTKSKEGQEILEDVMLREATREFFEFVKAVLKIETAAASAVAQTTDATDGNVAQQQQQQAEAVENKLVLSELGAYLLGTDSIALPLLHLILCAFSWPDSAALKKAVDISAKLVPLLIDDARYHQLLAADLFAASLRALASPLAAEHSIFIVSLIRDIYCCGKNPPQFQTSIVASLPNVTPEILQNFNASLMNKHPRKQRQLFRTFLQDTVGINATGKKTTILDLPEKLFVAKAMSASADWNDQSSFDLASLYSNK